LEINLLIYQMSCYIASRDSVDQKPWEERRDRAFVKPDPNRKFTLNSITLNRNDFCVDLC
jgi:hypothetical protein